MRNRIIFWVVIPILLVMGCSKGGDHVQEVILEIQPQSVELNGAGDRQALVIRSSACWTADCPDSWCQITPSAGKAGQDTLYVSAGQNPDNAVKKTTLTVTAGGILRTVTVTQQGYTPDGSSYAYLTASKGKGVKIVVMGDGFTIGDVAPGGKYDKAMQQAVDYLLDIEPFKSYRDYFTAWVVRAVSNESGISDYSEGKDTRFRAKYTSATSTIMTCDTAICFEYACKAPIENKLDETLVILVTNSSRYAGTTYMYTSGASIAICPMAAKLPYETFKGIVQHEAGGHGFAKLIDEYVYSPETLPDDKAEWIRDHEKYGFYANVDLTDDLTQIKWKHFIGKPAYDAVGAFEGGYKYAKGIWRPEQISCMDDMRPYFNAPSREAIVKRICQLAGLDYSFEDFLANDKAAGSVPQAIRNFFEPLPAPVVIHGSPFRAK